MMMIKGEADFDKHWKIGNVVADDDPNAALQSYASAFHSAEQDPRREALAALEIARLMSTRKEVIDLDTAQKFASIAYGHFFELSKSNMVERGRVSEAALTASRIELEIAVRDDSLDDRSNDGLAFAIMARDYASNTKESALAAFNFGNWLRMLRKLNAAEEFINAASLFEEIGDDRHRAHAVLFYGVSLVERGELEVGVKSIEDAQGVFRGMSDHEGVALSQQYLEAIRSA